ncbi:MAG: helix-turn-helix domain-containing protein [Actinomycetota bacterium]|nr:helix-turn-helix domain-containing protein [Actinomycetota bacterium]
MEDRPRAVGLFRYSLVAEAADPALTKRQRGELVRDVASRWHLGLAGERVRVSRNTLDRWIRAYRSGGFDALVPGPRHADPRTQGEVPALAETLRREEPRRAAEQIARLIAENRGWSPSARTLQRHLLRAGLPWRGSSRPEAFGRFEGGARNDLWTGDAVHGAVVGGRKTYLFAFIDDYVRHEAPHNRVEMKGLHRQAVAAA